MRYAFSILLVALSVLIGLAGFAAIANGAGLATVLCWGLSFVLFVYGHKQKAQAKEEFKARILVNQMQRAGLIHGAQAAVQAEGKIFR